MRTTIALDEDVAAAVEQLKRACGLGSSEAINRLVRAGLAAPRERRPFVQRTESLGLQLDVSNIADVLEVLEGSEAR